MSCRIILLLSLLFLFPGGYSSPAAAPQTGPSLPPGLANGSTSEEPEVGSEPVLPAGLGEESKPDLEGTSPRKRKKPGTVWPFDTQGFWEVRLGARTEEELHQREVSLAETRLQLTLQKYWDSSSFETTADFLYDAVLESTDVDLEEGTGFIDLREFKFTFTPFDFMDIRAGRQILTWGTGDLLFLNDLFPKDYRSFFIGRDNAYLKAPSDAVKVSIFRHRLHLSGNLDLVYTPRFDPDRFITGKRISYWNSILGRKAGRSDLLLTDTPEDWFNDDETALRLYRNIKGYEFALYGYWGYWKSPAGLNSDSTHFLHPELTVYGASFEGSTGPGIGNAEISYYISDDDENGSDPFVENSQIRVLVGYEQEMAKNFTASVQYYLEHMLDHDDYLDSLPSSQAARDENRQVLTLRLTKLMMMQTLEISLFVFYSPSDQDGYLRPRCSYDLTDRWRIEAGANLFLGDNDYTFFGQFKDNNNFYGSLRYSF